MSDRVYWFTNTIPASTPIATPFTANMSFNSSNVVNIEVIVPPGPAGSVGFQIWNGGGPWIPQVGGGYIIADDHIFEFDQNKAPDNGNWEFVGYNTDFVAHIIQVGFYINDFVASPVQSSSVIGI